jgi:hypothetical protein
VPLSYGPVEAKEVIGSWNTVTDIWKKDNIFVSSFVFPNKSVLVSIKETQEGSLQSSDNLKIVSVIVIKAKDFKEAVELAKLCPIINQGGLVEVNEVLQRPN